MDSEEFESLFLTWILGVLFEVSIGGLEVLGSKASCPEDRSGGRKQSYP